MGGARIRSEECLESGGTPRPAPSDADVYQEARRRGLLGPGGQVPMHDMARLRLEMAGEAPRPSYAEVCEAAGAVMRHRPLFPRH